MFWVILQEQQSIKTLEFTETNIYIYSFTCEKKIFKSSSYQWVDFFVNLLADRKAVNTKIFSAGLRYKPGFYFFSLNKI